MKPLVGKDKPFHSAVDKTAASLKRKVGTGAEFMKELMGVSGIKPTEIEERGLKEIMGMPRMTHDQFMANLSIRPAPAIREKVLGDEPDQADVIRRANANTRGSAYIYSESADTSREARQMKADESRRLRENHRPQMMEYARKELKDRDAPAHETWTLPGGKNYREMLIKAPKGAEAFQGVGGHFNGSPGILASMRLKDRTGPNGEKLLHLEELQSDWHQEGRKKGYKSDENEKRLLATNQMIYDLSMRRHDLLEKARSMTGHGPEFTQLMDEANSLSPKIMQLNDQLLEHHKIAKSNIPDAPFKKNWEEMALKRLIHHAAEKGYHGVVVTPGTEQADRYQLARHIDRVELHPNEFPNRDTRPYYFIAYDKNQRRVADDTVTPEQLEGHIGKELANRILSMEPNKQGERYLDNANLTTGDEAMKGFYDKKVPNILNSIGKKYGVKTQLHGHQIETKPASIERSGTSAYQVPAQTSTVHHFPITEDMRKDVLTNGLPLYNQGGKVHIAKGDDMDTMQLEMMRRHMATGGRPSTKGYVTHEPKNPHPEVGTRFKAAPQGNLAPMQAFDLMKHEGKGSIVPIPYDATTRDNLVTEVSGNQLINPLLTEAGFDYSLDPTHMAQNIGGASNSAIARRVQDRVDQAHKEHKGDVFLAPNIMGEDAENFSHHPAHIVLDLMAQRQLKPNTLKALSDDLRGQFELKRNPRTGETTKIYPYTKFLGYHHPKLMEQVIKGGHGLETTAGNLRKKMMERLSLVNMQKLLDYNMGDLKAAILDPDLATDPKAYMGRTMVKAQPGAALRPSQHTSYDTDYTGTNVGGLGGNRPMEIMMPDVYESINTELNARPSKVTKTPAQMRAQVVGALEKRKKKFAQPINARVINNAGLYAEGLRQGEFDPKNVDSVLAYFKRKGGYADGGTVDVKKVGVEEAPDMDVKAYFPPYPARSDRLPVGGIQQPPQPPQQPQQGMPPPQGAPMGMPPPQKMGQQPPSNILQMTPQGQAMSAMTPPAPQPKPPNMARGGSTRRVAYNSDKDAMMLELMQAKRYSNRK